MMRIAYVCADPGVPVDGHKGCSVHLQEVIRAFRRIGARVDLFAARLDGPPPEALEGVPIRLLPVVADDAPARHARAVASLNRNLAGVLDRAGPYDVVYERYSLWSFAAMEYARAAGVPGVLEVNAPLIDEQRVHRGLRDAAGADWASVRVISAATSLVAVSAEVAAWLERHPAVRGRLHVVPNGVDVDRFRPDVPPALRGPPGTFTIGFVGSMKPWHGLPVLIDAFARLQRDACGGAPRLLLVGTGPEHAAVAAQLAARGLTSTAVFAGAVAPTAVPNLLTSMDVAVAPYASSTHCYFSPLKVCEYMAAGRAVAASRVPALEGLVRHDEDGLLCPPGDAAALAAALDRLRRRPGLRTRLGRAARERIARSHTWDGVAGRLLAIAGSARGARTHAVAVGA
jgi:glycosyltransferase involved in cell wall biosynthesis